MATILRRLALTTVMFSVLAGSAAIAAQHSIFVITWRGCEEACQGFQDYLTGQGLDADFHLRDAGRGAETLPGFLAEARAKHADLILTWGTSATRGIAGTIDDMDNPAFNHDIPQVFTIVSDPVGAGVVKSLEETGRPNLTGTYNRVPESVNIETLRTYDPSFRQLGMLYNTNEPNSDQKYNELSKLSETMDFELIALKLPLYEDGKPRTEDIALKVAELKAAGVDFVYVGSSSFLRSQRDVFTGAAVEHKLPVLSPYEEMVRESQALLSVAARYYDVGRLAGAQAEKILAGSAVPGDLPVARMTDFAVVINMQVARELKLFPPIGLLQVAETVN